MQALSQGLLPVVYSSASPLESLDAYVSLYIREEVQLEGLVRKLGNFSRFLEAASFSHAAVLNTSSVARERQVERKAVETYISLLEDILLAFRLPVFSKKAKRALISHAKFYFLTPAFFGRSDQQERWTSRRKLRVLHWRDWSRSSYGHGMPMQELRTSCTTGAP